MQPDEPSTLPAAPLAEDRPPSARPSQTDQGAPQQVFIDRLKPVIEAENASIAELRQHVLGLSQRLDAGQTLRRQEQDRLNDLARKYRVDGKPVSDAGARRALLAKIDTIPVSLALAQAANESAWGTSRFAKEGNNLFGIWTYDASKGMVPRNRKPGKKHLVRKFDNIAASVRYYLHTLNSHPAYAGLRDLRGAARAAGRSPQGTVLASGLTRYSARGDEYVRIIQAMIKRFDLHNHDDLRRGQA